MWNITNELLKRESSFKSPFIRDCYGSEFLLKHMEMTLKSCRDAGLYIKFNHNGDFFGIRSMTDLSIWDTARRKSKFCIVESSNKHFHDFQFLNDFNNQNGLNNILISFDGQIEVRHISPDGSSRVVHTAELTFDRTTVAHYPRLTLCPHSETQLFCNEYVDKSIYQIDIRSDLVTVQKYKHKLINTHALAHNPIKPELCLLGSDSRLHFFDKRNLHNAVKEFEICPSVTKCTYNFDGSEILLTNNNSAMCLLYNDNSMKLIHHHDDTDLFLSPHFFGPKSEFLFGCSQDEMKFAFRKKLSKNLIHTVDFIPYTPILSFAIHPSKPIIVARDLALRQLQFLAPKGTYHNYFY